VTFVPVTKKDFYEDEPLYGHPAFKGGILKSDRIMDIETKEITETPTTEVKDAEVKSGAAITPHCTDPSCQYAGTWHRHGG
jgi:C-terminal processing protease CtpA/Prc